MKITLELTQDEFDALDEAASQPNEWGVDLFGVDTGTQSDDLEAAHKKLQAEYERVKK